MHSTRVVPPAGGEPAASSSLLIDVRPDALIVRLPGPALERADAPSLVAEIGRAIDAANGPGQFVLDLGRVNRLSGLGLGVCVELHRRAKARGMACAAFGLNAHLRDLFRMMRIDRLYRIVFTEAELGLQGA